MEYNSPVFVQLTRGDSYYLSAVLESYPCILFTYQAPFDMNKVPVGEDEVMGVLQMEVVFGTPSSACAGSGVCKMLPAGFSISKPIACPTFMVRAQFTSTTVILSLSTNQLTSEQWSFWFNSTYFIVEEDFTIPAWIRRKLQSAPLTIRAGCYPVLKNGGQIALVFSERKRLPFHVMQAKAS